MDLYPLFLRLRDRRVLVVGGGSVAARKIRELVAAHARVIVVAHAANTDVEAFAEDGDVELRLRDFQEDDLEGMWLVIAATNDSAVNQRVAAAAEERRIFVNAVDDPPHASAFFGAVIRRPPFIVAISSSGETPALTRLVREVLESVLPEQRWIEKARALRRHWKADATPMAERFAELVSAFAAEREGK
jgi:uroporphyrin-III C-methyltransferase / precorrin-2 dehydrogenase / sirohydrochlorin ferrochelatase